MSHIDSIIQSIKKETNKSVYYYLHGGCYRFAKILQHQVGGDILYLTEEAHCILKVDGKLYDVTGNVTNKYKDSKTLSEVEMVNRKKIIMSIDI